MQPDLPWNVAGIPPEAREAARAAARREGLSVGEWLTRKILRTLSDTAAGIETTPENWRHAISSNAVTYRAVAETAAAATRDTEDMLARVSRSEDESLSAYRRIETHLKSVARRLDAAERSQAENNRAMNKAATEINIATREQAQAFDQLDAHVTALADRLTRVEHRTAGSGIKEAIKGLHAGLSRLADQVAETANQSAAQISTLSQGMEALADRLAQARLDTESLSATLEERLAAVVQRIGAVEQNDGPARALAELREELNLLNGQVSESKAETGGTLRRLEESVANLEQRADQSDADDRLQSLERIVTDLASRYNADALKAELRELDERLNTADRGHRQNVEEMRAELDQLQAAHKQTQDSSAAVSPGQHNRPNDAHVQPDAQPSPTEFDLPPFPETASSPLSEDTRTAQAEANEFGSSPFDAGPGFLASRRGFGPNGGDDPLHEDGENGSAASYIAAARRHARAADNTFPAETDRGKFSWTAAVAPEKSDDRRGRYFLMGGAVVLTVVLATAVLFRMNGTRQQSERVSDLKPPVVAPLHPNSLAAARPDAQNPTATGAGDASKPSVSTPPPAARITPPAPTAAAKTAPTPKPVQAKQVTQKAPPISPIKRLAKAAQSGNVTAQTMLGLKYLDGDGVTANAAEGARWLERAAKKGQPVAQYRLGTLYERGQGVPSDPKQADAWYEAAAKQGNRKAMHNLAVAYAQGSGVPKNFAVAAQWFTKAARLGLRDSQFNLAVLYERGMGVPQSLTDAYMWYAVAAAHGDAESKARIAALDAQLSANGRIAAQRAAAAFKPDALRQVANVPPTSAGL